MKRPKPHDDTEAFEAALAETNPQHYSLRLFVSGTTPRSSRAIQNIRALCEERLQGRYELKVIDVYQHPERLQAERVVVTPTLVKKLPLPLRKIIGDLSDTERVLVALNIVPLPASAKSPEV